MEIQLEWVLAIVTVVIVVLLLAYFAKKSIVSAIETILADQAVIANTEKIVESQPESVQGVLDVVHRQLDMIEGLLRNAGVLGTPVGVILDKVEDFVEKITDDVPEDEKPPEAPAG